MIRKLLNTSTSNPQWFQKLNVHSTQLRAINKGPFISTPMYSARDQEYIPKNHFQNSVLKSFQLGFISLLKALQNRNEKRIKNLTRPNLASQLLEYLDYLKNKNKELILQNLDDFQITIENIVGLKYIYGIPLESKAQLEQYKPIEVGQQKPNKIHRVYYVNKNLLNHQREKIILVDLIISTNLKPKIVDSSSLEYQENNIENNYNDTEIKSQNQMQKQQSIGSSKYNNYMVQLISHSKYQNYDFPHVVDVEKWKDLLGEELFKDQEINEEYIENIVNSQFISSQKQEQYEKYGWKINNINQYIQQPTAYHAI
ncbi:hypothetical protein PPERSA_10643 [Pseudocohnilembus persalinus]|uniref:Uncharacterized protein n=1 Tax=Pseudocohnilembus persalinus TaxID=266149 RepID=A0A0V0QDC9_PSEPJ|nr:hypothetical protein PPERSA_10643 [Pseudocohnilembus persalinus]|eukprot:KRX00144.1 hypothetical protein PPERSA_10643 [Pseudocohnilembus persalinus]